MSKPYLTASPEERLASEVADLKARLAALESRIERPIATAMENWITPTLNSGWSDYGSGWASAAYCKDPLDIVYLRGLVVATAAAGTTIFTLPAEYRPPAHVMFATLCTQSSDATTLARLDVRDDGAVRALIPDTRPFAWFSITCCFRAG